MTRSGFPTNGAAARIAGGESSVTSRAGGRWLPAPPIARPASPRARWRGAGRREAPRQKAASRAHGPQRRTGRTDQLWLTREWSASRSWLLLLAGHSSLSQMTTLLAVFTARLPAVSFLTPVRLTLRAGWRYGPSCGGAAARVAEQRWIHPSLDPRAGTSARQPPLPRS